MNKIISFFIFLIVISCTEDKWKTFKVNKFVTNNIIDTTKYKKFDEEFKGKKIKSPSFEAYSYYHFDSPIVLDSNYVFIEQKHFTDKNRNVILKLDKKGNIIDSLTINKHSTIINNYIIENNNYISWFIDNDKTKKSFINKSYYLESDTLVIKKLVKDLKKNNVIFWSTSEYDNEDNIDTCNYIISFQNSELVKFNYLKKIGPSSDLKITNINPYKFSDRFKDLEISDLNNFFKVDNFFAHSADRLIRKGTKIHPSDIFSNTGIGHTTGCNTYKGTSFITLFGIKLKIANQEICENKSLQESINKPVIYSANFLDFYLIDIIIDGNSKLDYYYVLKK